MGLRWWRRKYKYIKNASKCETVLTRHLLNAGRRTQTSKRARKSLYNWIEQKEEETEREKEVRTGHAIPGKKR